MFGCLQGKLSWKSSTATKFIGPKPNLSQVGRTHWTEVRAGPAVTSRLGSSLSRILSQAIIPAVTAPGWPGLQPSVGFSLEPNSSSIGDQDTGQGPESTVSLQVQGALIWPRNSPDDLGPYHWMLGPGPVKESHGNPTATQLHGLWLEPEKLWECSKLSAWLRSALGQSQ